MVVPLLLLLPALWMPHAYAFVLLSYSGKPRGSISVAEALRYPAGPVTVYYNPDMTAMGGSLVPKVSNAQWATAVALAVSAWQGSLCTSMNIVFGGATTVTNVLNLPGKNNLFIYYDNRTAAEGSFCAQPGAIGCGGVDYIGKAISYGVVQMNGNYCCPLSVDGTSGVDDLPSAIMHEMGHALGLYHNVEVGTYTSTNPYILNSFMGSSGDVNKYWRALGPDELDFLSCIYPAEGVIGTPSACSSYQGTNGNGALSGTTTAGPPTATGSVCDTGLSIPTVQSRDATGGGCAPSAFASSGYEGDRTASSSPWVPVSWLIELLLPMVILRKLMKRKAPECR